MLVNKLDLEGENSQVRVEEIKKKKTLQHFTTNFNHLVNVLISYADIIEALLTAMAYVLHSANVHWSPQQKTICGGVFFVALQFLFNFYFFNLNKINLYFSFFMSFLSVTMSVLFYVISFFLCVIYFSFFFVPFLSFFISLCLCVIPLFLFVIPYFLHSFFSLCHFFYFLSLCH